MSKDLAPLVTRVVFDMAVGASDAGARYQNV